MKDNNYVPFVSEVEEFNALMGKNWQNRTTPTINQADAEFVINFIQEELDELKEAVKNKDIVEIFDALLDTIAKAAPLEVSVVEDFSEITDNVEVDIDQAEDTMTILNKYVDGLTLPVESDKIKTVLRDVYNEALSMETA